MPRFCGILAEVRYTCGRPMAQAEEQKALKSGDVLAGRYRLVAPIGEGGMGFVWEARQVTTDKPVAIKVLKRVDGSDSARFLREARVAAALSHRNIVQVFDFWEVEGDGPVFMVMELLRGQPLSEVLEATPRLSLAETLSWALPVAAAIRAAHAQKVVHRDLKPENIFFARESKDEAPVVKVLDFGLAKPFVADVPSHATALTQTGSVLGTPYYMAPEQVYGEKDIDDRADVWALAVILYECLAGQRPFTGENFGQIFRRLTHGEYVPLHEAAPHLPPLLSALVTRMLSHERGARPGMDEVLDTLLVLEQAHGAHPPTSVQPLTATRAIPMQTPRGGFVSSDRPLPVTRERPISSERPPTYPPPFVATPPPAAAPEVRAPTVVAAAISVKKPPQASKAVAMIGLFAGALLAITLGGFFALRPPSRGKAPDLAPPAIAPLPPAPTPLPAMPLPETTAAAPQPASSPTAPAAAPSASTDPNAASRGRAKPKPSASPAGAKDPLNAGRF